MEWRIVYRGKNLDGRWIQGHFLGPVAGCHTFEIVDPGICCGDRQEIIEDTLGFSMGHYDSAGCLIFLHDRVQVSGYGAGSETKEGHIVFDGRNKELVIRFAAEDLPLREIEKHRLKVVGTLYDLMDDEGALVHE